MFYYDASKCSRMNTRSGLEHNLLTAGDNSSLVTRVTWECHEEIWESGRDQQLLI
jgi:hypothetical protein